MIKSSKKIEKNKDWDFDLDTEYLDWWSKYYVSVKEEESVDKKIEIENLNASSENKIVQKRIMKVRVSTLRKKAVKMKKFSKKTRNYKRNNIVIFFSKM